MNYIKQANCISDESKEMAIEIFHKSVAKLANKNYEAIDKVPFVELSAIFGEAWILQKYGSLEFCAERIAEANTAFNYANYATYSYSCFELLAEKLVKEEHRVSNEKLAEIGKTMAELLTNTTAKKVLKAIKTQ